jgi:hypothetical protein
MFEEVVILVDTGQGLKKVGDMGALWIYCAARTAPLLESIKNLPIRIG